MAEDRFAYKNSRGHRQASVDATFESGMSYTTGALDGGYVKTLVNYDFEADKKWLIPRAGLRTTEFVFPDIDSEIWDSEEFNNPDVCIKDMKECIEDGQTYVQCVVGLPDADNLNRGKIWVMTFRKKNDQNLETEFVIDGEDIEIAINDCLLNTESRDCVFYSTELQEIHGLRLKEDSRTGFPVGNFAFGNSYYFFAIEEDENQNEVVKLCRTVWHVPEGELGRYVFEEVDVKTITASEAVLYGYNMLSKTPYSFENSITGSKIVLEGILPYASTAADAELVMTPKANQRLNYRCYYTAPADAEYEFVWEWRTTDDDAWTEIDREIITVGVDRPSSVSFVAPIKNIMVRVQAYNTAAEDYHSDSPTIEHAMVVGFDFTIDNYGTTTNVEQKNYELGNNTGMTVWKNRLLLWGLPEDPTILFISDMNEPGYFPYPNNITVFDDPIITVLDFMDKLIVFTATKCCQVELSEDGNSWNTSVVQANLNITRWDKHLIQAVRNMIYFKSGNYYYMMVPKAKSTTGDLTLAPISNPMTEFFNHFMANVEQLLKDTYGPFDSMPVLELITYFNFLDYEDVHNFYVFTWDGADTLIHLDVMYNTVSRVWKISIFEEANLLYIYKHDATQLGTYATTTLMDVIDLDEVTKTGRVVQLFKYDPLHLRDFYIPKELVLFKANYDFTGVAAVNEDLRFPEGTGTVTDEDITTNDGVVDFVSSHLDDGEVYLLGSASYIGGYKISALAEGIQSVLNNYGLYFKFRNYQFMDTGYRADNLHWKKRYRELQLHINNLDSDDLSFGTEFFIDGDIRQSIYKYEVTQNIDEMNDDYNVAYVEPMVYMDIPADEIDLSNSWTIEKGLHPEISLWKVRMQVSGKGSAPRLKLSSRKEKRYQLLGLNWIYRVMNMR